MRVARRQRDLAELHRPLAVGIEIDARIVEPSGKAFGTRDEMIEVLRSRDFQRLVAGHADRQIGPIRGVQSQPQSGKAAVNDVDKSRLPVKAMDLEFVHRLIATLADEGLEKQPARKDAVLPFAPIAAEGLS